MMQHVRFTRRSLLPPALATSTALCLLAVLLLPPRAQAQGTEQTGSVAGRVTDEQGAPIGNAQVYIDGTAIGSVTNANGTYTINGAPTGRRLLRARIIGYRSVADSITVTANQRTTHNFSLVRDPLQLQQVVVTGTQAPRINIQSSVAVTTLPLKEIDRAVPRSTTEMLRYVPGFTRVESSGGEVNENISMRGVLGVEYVMFMEDGMPVFPTMHTFFMNADNLFRPDLNIERMEVVRGGSSALFGSNTPGAIINFINKTGGDAFAGSMRATVGTHGLARYDLNTNGPLGDDWRFNIGGFYRYDHGLRDPGFPGIHGGQLKASATRLLDNGYIRFSGKVIDDRNQFILDLPFTDPSDPRYVPGFGDYGSFNTAEGLGLRVPTPSGDLTLPLGNGLATTGGWFTVDAAFDVGSGWHVQNTGQVMTNRQEWNALVPSNAMSVADFMTGPKGQGGLALPAGSTIQLTYTNVLDAAGKPLPFSTPNGLVAPGQLIHVSKPISAVQDQLQVSKTFGKNTISAGAYIANYSQDNHWYFTQILTDVGDNTHFLDAVVTKPGGTPTRITQNGFLNQMSGYTNGTGQTSIVSGVLGGSLQLTDRLRADLGVRVESDDYVQSSEKTATFDLDGDSTTTFNNETFGDGSFLHFSRRMTDWASSIGLNYSLKPNLALYASAARGYKMPALDEFLTAQAQQAVDLFKSREVQSAEGGVKGVAGPLSFTVGGFYTLLRNIVSQGLVIDSVTGGSKWIVKPSPDNRSYGAEVELAAAPIQGLQVFGNGTFLRAELGSGAGADIGSLINGVPKSIANLSATYSIPNVGGLQLLGDWHWVGSRFVDVSVGTSLPQYSYFNFGAAYALPQGTTIDLNVVNAFQGKGLEEGNPRLLSTGGTPIFLARPILPRRILLSMTYDFGAIGAPSGPGHP
ncbi:MAG TPA: TonB-dependent receptor [Gemmatimonadaceae bacterium]|nr:TonB-dependent receptor [Gemmatimonadaceae bacterium]